MLRRFILFAWRVRLGWVLVLVLGAGAAAMSIALFAAFPWLQKPVHPPLLASCLLWFALICFALFLGMLRRALRGSTVTWDQLPPAGKVQRAAVTMLGTACLLAPLAWIVWLILR